MIKITGGLIYDGLGEAPYSGDILINGDKIKHIAPHISADVQTIDATGFAVTPGFVDTHRHFDFNALTNVDFGKLELLQGITTGIGGNCGLAAFPSSSNSREEVYSFLQPCLGESGGFKLTSATDYYNELLKKDLPINVGMLAATGAVKACVKGFDKTPYTAMEMQTAQALLCETLEAGAVGISCGIMYTPECYTSKEEFISLLKPAAKYNRILTSHIRGEGDGLLSSVSEVIDIAKGAGLRLNISHFKAVGRKNWKKTIFKAIELIENERAKGFEISADFYPFTGGATTLMSLIPPSFVEASTIKTIEKLETAAGRSELKQHLLKTHIGWDNMVADIGWDRIVISGVASKKNKRYCLKTISDICNDYDFSCEVDFIAELLCEEKGQVSINVMSMHEDDLVQIARLPYTALISDALYGVMDTPHPRLYSSFPKFLSEFAVNKKLLSVEQAIYKMTAMPAQRFSMAQRGRLAPNASADINIFKLSEINAAASFEKPAVLSSGMSQILIGGKVALLGEQITRGFGCAIMAE